MKKFSLILIFLFIAITPVEAFNLNSRPTLAITTLDGKNFDLRENLGKVIIINFWAKWCVDCRKEMLILDEIYREYKSHNLEIIGINIERKSQRQKILEVASIVSYHNSMIYNAKEISFEEPNVIPVSYIIDKEGKIIAKITTTEDKEITKQDFENVLQPLL